jgi:hypothetical protein
MKKKDLEILHGVFTNMLGTEGLGVKFSYFLSRNLRLIEEELKDIERVIKPDEEFEQYNNKRIEVCEQYAKKNDEGEAITEGEGSQKKYIIDENRKQEFDKEIEDLQKEYEMPIKRQTEKTLLLEEEADFTPHKIKIEDIKEHPKITPAFLYLIDDFIMKDKEHVGGPDKRTPN